MNTEQRQLLDLYKALGGPKDSQEVLQLQQGLGALGGGLGAFVGNVNNFSYERLRPDHDTPNRHEILLEVNKHLPAGAPYIAKVDYLHDCWVVRIFRGKSRVAEGLVEFKLSDKAWRTRLLTDLADDCDRRMAS